MALDLTAAAETMRAAIADGEALAERHVRLIARMHRAGLPVSEAVRTLEQTRRLVKEASAALRRLEEQISDLHAMPAHRC